MVPRVEVTSRGCFARRARPSWAKADALQAYNGHAWGGAAGYGSKRPHTDRGDNVGNHPLPAGACSNLRRPNGRASCKAGWRHWVGRMSQYEQRRSGNAGRGGARRLPEPGNACLRRRGSRQVAGGMARLRLDTEPGCASPRQHRRAEGITRRPRGVCGQALEPRVAREGPSGKAAAANRTREIRPSGMSPHGRLPTPMDETGGVLGYASGAGSTQARSLSGVTNPWMSLGSARWTPNCRRASTLA